MDQSLNPITKSVFNDLLETQIRLREEAEGRWQAARRFILEVTGYVASEWLFEKQTSGVDLDRISLETLISVIREHIPRLVAQTASAPVQVADPDLRKKYQRLEEKFRQAEALVQQLTSEKDNLANTLRRYTSENGQTKVDEKAIKAAPQYKNWEELPAFFVQWTNEKFFERQAALIRLIGDTGLARHPELEKEIAEITDLTIGSESIANIFKALREKNFIKSYTMDGGLRGQPPGVDELTELGELVYLILTGRKPQTSEVTSGLDEHKTHAHLRLILKSKDWLKKAGYEILDQDARFILDENRQFNPDVIAKKDDRVIYIEVERDSKKTNQDRDAKWNNFYDFAGGEIYVFCQNERTQRNIIHEINVALRGGKLERAKIYLCDLDSICDEFVRENGHVWTSIRQRLPAMVSNKSEQ